MRKFFDRLGAICLGLLILFLLEGLFSYGAFLRYTEYGVLGWVFQSLAVYVTAWASVRMQEANSY